MKTLKYYLFIFMLIALGCQKAKTFSIDLSQITETDALGNISGQADPTDWGMDSLWSENENLLFLSDPIDLSESKQAVISMNPLFPNPVSNRNATFSFNSSDTSFVRIAIVNEQLKRLAFFTLKTSSGLNAFSIPFPESDFPASRKYRIYYSFDTFSKPGYFKGHGDVSIR